MPVRIVIVAGEASGDLYGALLTKELFNRWPRVEIAGVGGPNMEKAGVNLLGGITGAFGFTETFSSLSYLKRLYDKLDRYFKTMRVDTLVLIDFPDFNIKLAEAARKQGIRILYYVSPQVWAWRTGRIKKIGRLCDVIAAILPFEPALYAGEPVHCEFVGHPVMEDLMEVKTTREGFRLSIHVRGEDPLVALLPGSRHSELKQTLPMLLATVRTLKMSQPTLKYVIPLVSHLNAQPYESVLTRLRREGVIIVQDRAIEALKASDAAVITSGTAAMQAALIGTPMVVIYKMTPLSYAIAKRVIKVKYINLVNLIFDREIVKELIQMDATPENIANQVERLFNDTQLLNDMRSAFRRLAAMYANKKTTERVVELIANLTQSNSS